MRPIFPITAYLILLFPSFVLANITKVNNFDILKSTLESSDKETLVIFDVDYTLIYPEGDLFHPDNKETLKESLKKIEDNASSESDSDRKQSEVYLNSTYSLVSPEMPLAIQSLKERNIKTIALTFLGTDPWGNINSMKDWRINQLEKLGIDFSWSFPKHKDRILKEPKIQKYGPSLFSQGVVFSANWGKDEILDKFLNYIDFKPSRIILIDDSLRHLEAISKYCKNKKIHFTGIEYSVANNKPFSDNADINFIKDFVGKNNIESISSLITKWHSEKDSLDEKYKYPDIFHAIYKSFGSNFENLHIDHENPRILLEMNNSILAFSGNPKDNYSDTAMEVISYNENLRELELYLLQFKNSDSHDKKLSILKNPKFCLGCHTAYTQAGEKYIENGKNRIRYIWDNYFVWPGYYGSHNGKLAGNEKTNFKKFLENAKTNKIYKPLPKKILLRKLKEKNIHAPQTDPIGIRYILADIGGTMFRLQQKIVYDDILDNFPSFKYAVVGSVGCPDADYPIDSFLPPQVKSQLNFPNYQDVLSDTIDKTNKDFKERIKLVRDWTGAEDTDLNRANKFLKPGKSLIYTKGFYNSPEMVGVIARLRYVVDSIWKPGILTWTMAPYKDVEKLIIDSRKPNTDYSFAHGRFNFEDLRYWKPLIKNDPELLQYYEKDQIEMEALAQELRDQEKKRLHSLLIKYKDTSKYEDVKETVALRLEELEEQPAIQSIWNYQRLAQYKIYLNDKEYSGYKITPTRRMFCEKLREKSLATLNATISTNGQIP